MPRTEGSKNRPKTNTTKDYASQIAEKQESITSLTAEITAIQKAIEEQKNTLKERKSALKNIGVRHQCGQPSVNLRQVPGQSNGQWCEIGKRGKQIRKEDAL